MYCILRAGSASYGSRRCAVATEQSSFVSLPLSFFPTSALHVWPREGVMFGRFKMI